MPRQNEKSRRSTTNISIPVTKYNKCIQRQYLTRFNKIVIQGASQMAVDKEAISLSRVYSHYSKCNLP